MRPRPIRCYGAAMRIGNSIVGHHGGLGPESRTNTTDVYSNKQVGTPTRGIPPPTIAARMCHTMTELNDDDCLLVGGRTAPGNALADCWIRLAGLWEKSYSLPTPRYRHCATRISMEAGSSNILIFGGKDGNGIVQDHCLVWQRH